jgi:hypothetical protein
VHRANSQYWLPELAAMRERSPAMSDIMFRPPSARIIAGVKALPRTAARAHGGDIYTQAKLPEKQKAEKK